MQTQDLIERLRRLERTASAMVEASQEIHDAAKEFREEVEERGLELRWTDRN